MSNISKDGAGKTIVVTENGTKIALSTQETRREHTELKRYPTTPVSSKFKLVTVRRLTDYKAEDLNNQLEATQKELEVAALRTGQPVPYPIRTVSIEDAPNVYGVFVDEDLYGRNAPVYTFTANVAKVKCYISTSGISKNDWAVYIAHLLEKTANPDNTFTTRWRIVTIESNDTGRTYHVLEDSALPTAYQFNFGIDSLNYLGGGTWTGMSIDPVDRVPVYASALATDPRYIPAGQIFKFMGETRVRSIVTYSVTPTYVFTWQKGQLSIKKRQREASQEGDVNLFKTSGVYGFTRKHNYSLEIPVRLENKANSNDIAKFSITETSNGEATYVANTNAPEMASAKQTPDFGTDKKRMSISRTVMSTNLIRPVLEQYQIINKISKCPLNYAGIVCSSPDMSVFLRHNLGEARGSIEHPYETKLTTGKRGFQYGEAYKLWWTYGRVLETYAIGDTNRYRKLKSPGFDANGKQLPDRVVIGSMFDLGELKVSSQFPNVVETTWNSRQFPQTGYFGFEEGELTFAIQYLNPPLLGHQGVYYYHINPEVVGQESSLYEVDDERFSQAEERDRKNTLRNFYVQILGGLAGASLDNLDIGNIIVAPKDTESIIVREPNSTQKAALQEDPHIFPSGFFEAPFYSFTLSNDNVGEMYGYDSEGNPGVSYRFV